NGVGCQQPHLLLFHLLPRGGADRQIRERHLIKLRQPTRCFMVAYDKRQVAGELSTLMTVEEICQAMKIMRDEDCHILRRFRKGETPIHSELCGQWSKDG